MIQIIPAIIARDFSELEQKIKRVEPYVDWVQLDVMDGRFVENATWNSPAELKEIKTRLNLEAHLMIQNPEQAIDDWINSGVKRIIFHYEATKQHKEIIDKIKQADLEAGLAINPETAIADVGELTSCIDLALMMSVRPGSGGQEFIGEMLWKIRALRQRDKNVRIGVDGGINLENASEAVAAGADVLNVGSAIFGSADISETIKKFKKIS